MPPKKLNDVESMIQLFSGLGVLPILSPFYGFNKELIQDRIPWFIRTLKAFHRSFPTATRVGLVRVPGRINLMGVHIDHQGGWCNYRTMARETVFCFSPREDDQIHAVNWDPQYSECSFSISQELPESRRGDWLRWIEGVSLQRGFWGNYLKAGVLKLQDKYSQLSLRGMNLAVGGDVPAQSGLSSSSTLVVGSVLALCAVNGLDFLPENGVELCGEAEWYVGTRGGSGDHAAMLLGRPDSLTHVGFKPLNYRYCPFPPECEVILCHSGIDAAKAGQARILFNLRIAAYAFAFQLYRHQHPRLRDRLQYVRDISPDHLNLSLSEFYNSLQKVPVSMSVQELIQTFPDLKNEFDRILALYGEPVEPLPLREVLLFGVGECDRAQRFPQAMKANRIAEAGALMYISHDGDRVSVWNNGSASPYRSPYDDDYLDSLARQAEQNPQVTSLLPAFQPGGYRCSIPQLDQLVDRCRELPGVWGAGLTGAGLGGAILVLVQPAYAAGAMDELRRLIATWSDRPPWVELCRPVAGASLIPIPT